MAVEKQTKWVREHFACDVMPLYPEERLEFSPLLAGYFLACKACGGEAPRGHVCHAPTLDAVAAVEHRGDCETRFLIEVIKAAA